MMSPSENEMDVNSLRSQEINQPVSSKVESPNTRPLLLAGLILGLGQGGFFDGIVFHQLLQWHHMFSSLETDQTLAGIELNTLGDGLFHLADWLFTLFGIFLLWRAGRNAKEFWSGRFFCGALLIGVGAFNLVEGLIDHQILGIHHLRPGPNEFLWDMGFLGSGVAIASIGLMLLTSARSIVQNRMM